MSTKTKSIDERVAQNPLILRCHRLMEAFAKSDDERDFYVDRQEGFIVYVDLDKAHTELAALERALKQQPERFCLIPKLTFYETKKIMEGFVNEKVYDIDTKERLLDIISSKSARDNFLEFIYDHHAEQEKWQQYYQERSRIRIIEWLRKNHFQFVFEEDLDFPHLLLDRIKTNLFDKRVGKEVENARKVLLAKAKTYYSNEALNPRPKRGRPPKAVAKMEVEPQASSDIYTAVPSEVRPFLFTPDMNHAWLATFSSKFESEEQILAGRKVDPQAELSVSLENLNKKLESLRQISHRLVEKGVVAPEELGIKLDKEDEDETEVEDIDEMDDVEEGVSRQKNSNTTNERTASGKTTVKSPHKVLKAPQRPVKARVAAKKPSPSVKKVIGAKPKPVSPKKAVPKKTTPKKLAAKTKPAPAKSKAPISKGKLQPKRPPKPMQKAKPIAKVKSKPKPKPKPKIVAAKPTPRRR